MKKIYQIALLAAVIMTTGCSKENPFDSDSNGEGKFLKSALAVDMKVDETLREKMPQFRGTRADVDLNEFNVVFKRQGDAAPTAKYKYSEMPEIVTLPAGTYTVTATCGEDRNAEWENPYFLGTSASFDVTAYEITSYIDPVECRLENIKVTIDFDPVLLSRMSPDSYVEVKVGDNEGLKYGTSEASAQKAGYFRHTSETSLVATFNGKIDGVATTETKSYVNVEKGNHYRVTFKLHDHNGTSTGDANADVMVDASVTVISVERNVDVVDEEKLLDDSERPSEDNGGAGKEDPEPAAGEAPTITATAPIVLDVDNVVDASSVIKLVANSTSAEGFTEFTCDIISNSLTPAELSGFGLSSHLDLVNTPSDMAVILAGDPDDPESNGLGFPVYVGGKKSVSIDMTPFVELLGGLGPDTHKFVLKVGDANGTTTKTLILVFK